MINLINKKQPLTGNIKIETNKKVKIYVSSINHFPNKLNSEYNFTTNLFKIKYNNTELFELSKVYISLITEENCMVELSFQFGGG